MVAQFRPGHRFLSIATLAAMAGAAASVVGATAVTIPVVPAGLAASPQSLALPRETVEFSGTGYTELGEWRTEVVFSPDAWRPQRMLKLTARLTLTEAHLAALAAAGIPADSAVLLLTAERTFDAGGRLRLASDERMSTLVAPTGLAIEGGVQGAVTSRFGYDWSTPVDVLLVLALPRATGAPERTVTFETTTRLPSDLPPGIYRLRLDYGVRVKNRYYSLNGEAFAYRPFFQGRPTESHIYSPPLPASGRGVSGEFVDARLIRCRVPWIILGDYNSNGHRGVVAEEDSRDFALSNRNLIPDDTVLPLYDDGNRRLAYSLEPQFPADLIEARSAIPWDFASGELTVEVTNPDGTVSRLGTAPFIKKRGNWPSTGRSEFTSWSPPAYGSYKVKATGWINDVWGNRYEGGGTYRFWIAKRLTLATATFQGVPYPVGAKYGRDLAFAPAVPADVEVSAVLYRNSDRANAATLTFTGQATTGGIFTAAQGAKQLTLDAPGEYAARILAKYTDAAGHLWVCSYRHAGVVYPTDSPLVAHGKKLKIGASLVDRGETHDEGWQDAATGEQHLVHITFPYLAGDALLIASEQQYANKIEPVLIYEDKARPAPYDPKLQGIGVTNLKLRTSNGYSPHLFPEYITDWAYYYAAAPRPGFISRFLVAENGSRAPYWQVSPNNFGGQIGASNNGDLPGDIYRLLGGVVLRRQGQPPLYAGYLASAFILPKGTKNNRVIAPGSEDLIPATGERGRFYLVSTRPGMLYETGTTFVGVAQIDPILPATVRVTLRYPDGRVVSCEGVGDAFGSFAAPDRWTLDMPGVYRYWIEGTWQGFRGTKPGLPAEGGFFYVIEKERPAGAAGIKLNLPAQTTFSPSEPFAITGTTTAAIVAYAAIIPGAVIDQGELPATNGSFRYVFDPVAISSRTPTYDIRNLVSGKSEIGDVVHLTFFSRETTAAGTPYHAFARVVFRGTKVIYAK